MPCPAGDDVIYSPNMDIEEHPASYGTGGGKIVQEGFSFSGLMNYFNMVCTPCVQETSEKGEYISPYLGHRGTYRDTRDFEDPGILNRTYLNRDEVEPELYEQPNLSVAETDAQWLVQNFCRRYTRVVPSELELCNLAAGCAILPQDVVAGAFCKMLSWSSGDLEWQPRLRVLHALKHIAAHSEDGPNIVKLAVRDTTQILWHLRDEIPECSDLAEQVLTIGVV